MRMISAEAAMEPPPPAVNDDTTYVPVGDLLTQRGYGWHETMLSAPSRTKPTIGNVISILENDPRINCLFAYNERTDCVVFSATPMWRPGANGHRIVDEDITRLVASLESNYRSAFGWDITYKAVMAVAKRRSFDPVRTYLDGLTWDGTSRLGNWLTTCLGAESTMWNDSIGRAWLISAVARAYQPGCKADHCLVLEGTQGAGKSTALSILAGDYFTDDLPDMHSKDATMCAASSWIVELAELAAARKSDQESIKSFITRTTDKYRPSYGRLVIERPRRYVFAASTNSSAWLHDETGGRRFWPVRVGHGKVRLDVLHKHRDQLWAEAVVAYRNREPWHLVDERLIEVAKDEQEARRVRDPWETKLIEFLDGRDWVTLGEVMTALDLKIDRQTHSDSMRAVRVMAGLGWRKMRKRTGDQRTWGYSPGPVYSHGAQNDITLT